MANYKFIAVVLSLASDQLLVSKHIDLMDNSYSFPFTMPSYIPFGYIQGHCIVEHRVSGML